MRDGDFTIRSTEISRIEGLSDAVFGFAITLLVVSLEVPKTAGEVLHAMRGFFAFAVTFSILFMVWRTQFKFFRRYGLEDDTTVWLSAGLLFTVLLFVYPLKFVFTVIVERILMRAGFGDSTVNSSLSQPGMHLLQAAYGLGWFAVFGIFHLLYRHAHKKRHELKLNPLEVFDTEEAIFATRGASLVGLFVAILNIMTQVRPAHEDAIAYAGLAVIALPLVIIVRRRRTRRARRTEALAGHP